MHSFSDHCSLLVNTKALSASGHGKEVRSFKFNDDWCLDMESENLIKDYWLSTDKFLPEKLNGLGLCLTDWNLTSLRNSKAYKVQMEKRLSELSSGDPSDETLLDSINVRLELNREAEKEEIYWEQRARVNWLKHGDRNTTFFHKSATMRKRRNFVKGLENDLGKWVDDEKGIMDITTNYFKNFFPSIRWWKFRLYF